MAKTDKSAASETVKAPRVVLTKEQRNAIFKAAGGKCWVFGTQLDPLEPWHVDENRLVSPAAKKLKGARTFDELRDFILKDLADAQAASERLRREHVEAEAHYEVLKEDYGPLVEGNVVRFAGEQAA